MKIILILIITGIVVTVCGDDIIVTKNHSKISTKESKIESPFGISTYLLLDIFKFIPRIENISENCHKDIKELEAAINSREIWAMKALESSAMVSPNFVYGNHFWLGSRDECRLINNPKSVTFTTNHYKMTNKHLMEKPLSLKLDYKVAWANIAHSPLEADSRFFRNREILHMGFCLPVSCSEDDVHTISTEYLYNNESLVKGFYEVEVNSIEITDLRLTNNFRNKFSLIMFCVAFALTFLLIGASFLRLEVARHEKLSKILSVFHPKRNLDTIFIVTASEFPEMNGMKFCGAFIILFFHVIYFSVYKLSSRFLGIIYAESLELILFINGALFVEMFLVMSGFLSAYNYLRNKEQTKYLQEASFSKLFKFFTSNLFKRLVRIVPLYVMVMVMTELAASLVRETSPIKLWDNDDYNCRNYWWRNLLFIQNFYTGEELCMNWSWTIACEMQYYVCGTILYIIYCKNKKKAKIIYWISAVVLTFASIYYFVKHNFAFSFDILFKQEIFDDTYISSTRAPPYLVGMAMAYLLVKGELNVSKQSANTLWILALVVIPTAIGCTLNRTFHKWAAIAFVIPLKWLLPFSFGWIFLSPRLGHKNFVTEALAHDTFYHFGKIGYAFYLVNPLLLIIFNGLSPNLLHVDTAAFVVFNAGIGMMSVACAVFLTILFEMPYIKLLRLSKKSNKTIQTNDKEIIKNQI